MAQASLHHGEVVEQIRRREQAIGGFELDARAVEVAGGQACFGDVFVRLGGGAATIGARGGLLAGAAVAVAAGAARSAATTPRAGANARTMTQPSRATANAAATTATPRRRPRGARGGSANACATTSLKCSSS